MPSVSHWYDLFAWTTLSIGLSNALNRLVAVPSLLVLVVMSFGLVWTPSGVEVRARREIQMLLVLFVIATLVHSRFASASWASPRYEAYLLPLGLVTVGSALARATSGLWCGRRSAGRAVVAVVAFVLAIQPIVGRGVELLRSLPTSGNMTYRYYYQVGLFLQQHPPAGAVMIPFIGPAAYLSDLHIADPEGLASLDMIRARVAHTADEEAFRRLAREHGVTIMIINDDFRPLPEWICAGEWQKAVYFYAPNSVAADRLFDNLTAFEGTLPFWARHTLVAPIRDGRSGPDARPQPPSSVYSRASLSRSNEAESTVATRRVIALDTRTTSSSASL